MILKDAHLLIMNKVIWIYWDKGWCHAPQNAKFCLKSWRHYNPDYKVEVLNDKRIRKLIPEMFNDNVPHSPAAKSDIIRIHLIKKYGGVWVDSSVFCNKPLDNWLPSGTFMFSNPDKDRMVASWFIKRDEEDCPLINKWYDKTVQYWKEHDIPHTYFWFHYLFNDVYNSDQQSREIWDRQIKIDVDSVGSKSAHLLVPYQKTTIERSDEIERRILSKLDPVYKLSNKFPIKKDSSFKFLYNTIK